MSKLKYCGLLMFFVGILSSCSNQEFISENDDQGSIESSLTRSDEESESILLNIDAEPFATETFSTEVSEDVAFEIITEFLSLNQSEDNVVTTFQFDLSNQHVHMNSYSLSTSALNAYVDDIPTVKVFCNYFTGMSGCFDFYRIALDAGCTFSNIDTASSASNTGTLWMDC